MTSHIATESVVCPCQRKICAAGNCAFQSRTPRSKFVSNCVRCQEIMRRVWMKPEAQVMDPELDFRTTIWLHPAGKYQNREKAFVGRAQKGVFCGPPKLSRNIWSRRHIERLQNQTVMPTTCLQLPKMPSVHRKNVPYCCPKSQFQAAFTKGKV